MINKRFILLLLPGLCALLCSCASDDELTRKVDRPNYPRISNVRTRDYSVGLSSIPIRARVVKASPFIYNGKDSRFMRLEVLDSIYRRDNRLVIPSGTTIFAVQDRRTGRYANVTRIRKDGWDSWTPAYGIAEVAPEGHLSMVFLSKVSMPYDDDL
jgi:hypothetical protein